jgi:hypothetical protein
MMDTRVKPAYDAMCESSSRKRGEMFGERVPARSNVAMLQNFTA